MVILSPFCWFIWFTSLFGDFKAGAARLAGHRTGVRALAVAADDSMCGDLGSSESSVGNDRGYSRYGHWKP